MEQARRNGNVHHRTSHMMMMMMNSGSILQQGKMSEPWIWKRLDTCVNMGLETSGGQIGLGKFFEKSAGLERG